MDYVLPGLVTRQEVRRLDKKWHESELAQFAEQNWTSRRLWEEHANRIPAGSSRLPTAYYAPFTVFLQRGDGARVWDADGNARLDLVNNYTVQILGHGHPAVAAAVQEQMRSGVSFGGPHAGEGALAAELQRRLPSLELVRFTSSGTEAVAYALRAARAFTGRPAIAKFEGAFHGGADCVQVSIKPPAQARGPADRPASCPAGLGIPPGVLADVVVLPWGDLSAVRRILTEHKDRLAAVVVDPLMCVPGLLLPPAGFLFELRLITEELGILLVFDEVQSFRVGMNGAQGHFGVRPDLTALGKIIGGGFPIGAFGGRADIMSLYDLPARGGRVIHGGTYNGHPVAVAAGLATLAEMTAAAFSHLHTLGNRLHEQLQNLIDRGGYPVRVHHLGGLFNFHFAATPVVQWRDTEHGDARRLHAFFIALLNRGFFIAPRGYGCLSVPMTTTDIAAFTNACSEILAALFTGDDT